MGYIMHFNYLCTYLVFWGPRSFPNYFSLRKCAPKEIHFDYFECVMTRALSSKRRALKSPPIPVAIVKAKHNLKVRLTLFDYNDQIKPPKVVIIVPVRNRDNEKIILSSIYKKSSQMKIVFINQNWNLPFNKGAMINIGFLEAKKIFPNDFQNISFVIHDVDLIPFPNIKTLELIERFKTKHGIIKHLYGFQHSLGGVFSITGSDYEKIGGFANIYGWNIEDVIFQDRALSHNLLIDRSMPYFVDLDHGGSSLNLTGHVPFQYEYRIYFVSEWERDTTNDNIHTLQSYSLDISGCNLMVTAFKTTHDIDVTERNIRVCSRVKLPSSLIVKDARKKNVNDRGWYINQWSADLHGDVVKA